MRIVKPRKEIKNLCYSQLEGLVRILQFLHGICKIEPCPFHCRRGEEMMSSYAVIFQFLQEWGLENIIHFENTEAIKFGRNYKMHGQKCFMPHLSSLCFWYQANIKMETSKASPVQTFSHSAVIKANYPTANLHNICSSLEPCLPLGWYPVTFLAVQLCGDLLE